MRSITFDRVLVIPACLPPHKDRQPALSFEARAGALKDWFGGIRNLQILDLEQQRGGKSYTADTVEILQKQFPADTFYLLMGTDMFLSFETWHRFQDLLKQVILLVGTRASGEDSRLAAYRSHLESSYLCKGIILCKMEPIAFASSDLRNVGGGIGAQVLAYLGEALDLKRIRHTLSVAEFARELAQKNGVDPEKAYLAGLLHDCTKCCTRDWQLSYLKEHGGTLSPDDAACPQVLHQLTAPLFARAHFGVEDAAILDALRCHTTGKLDMSALAMLLFFADSCEPTRTYPGVEELRLEGERNLKRGTLRLLNHTISVLISRNAYLHPWTVAARNSLLKEFEQDG